jgi:hypothetical protein
MQERVPDGSAAQASPQLPEVRDWLLVALAFSAGAYEAICFLSFGKVFTGVQTGNLVFLGFIVAGTMPVLTSAVAKVVVKLGASGALSADGRLLQRVAPPAGLAGEVVDATGAGDCFNAGLIAGLLRGLDLAAATRLGCAAGSASTRAAGGTAAAPDLAAALALAETVRTLPVGLAAFPV